MTYFISRLAPSIEQIAKLYIPFKFVWDRFLEYNSYSKTPAVFGIQDTRQCHNATVEEIGSKVRLFNGFIKVVNYAIVALWPMDNSKIRVFPNRWRCTVEIRPLSPTKIVADLSAEYPSVYTGGKGLKQK